MRWRTFLLTFLAICLATSPSLAAVCEVNCSFGSNQTPPHSTPMTMAAGVKVKLAANHACCADRSSRPAFSVHHSGARQDCAINRQIQPQLPRTGIITHAFGSSQHAIQNASAEISAFAVMKAPLLIETASRLLPAASQLFILRV